jgi:hypothetical protein
LEAIKLAAMQHLLGSKQLSSLHGTYYLCPATFLWLTVGVCFTELHRFTSNNGFQLMVRIGCCRLPQVLLRVSMYGVRFIPYSARGLCFTRAYGLCFTRFYGNSVFWCMVDCVWFMVLMVYDLLGLYPGLRCTVYGLWFTQACGAYSVLLCAALEWS